MSSWSTLVQLVGTATAQTLIMVFFSTLFSFILGAPLGVLLCITAEGNLMPKPVLHQLIDRVVNVLRSFPFIILMGSSTMEIIFKVMIPEALPPLVAGITLTIINLIGYSAMAGAIGGGGLGDLAIRYGYQRFRSDIMLAAVIVILVMVELIQFIGTRISTALAKRR